MVTGRRLVRQLEPSLSGYRRYEVYLGGYLHTGAQHTLEYRILVSPGFDAPKPYYTISVDTPIPTARIRVTFAADAVPRKVSRVVSVFSSFLCRTSRSAPSTSTPTTSPSSRFTGCGRD